VLSSDAYAAAVSHHQRGELARAQELYRNLLAAEPAHAGALHGLGVLAYQERRFDEALGLLLQAVEVDGSNAEAWLALGAALAALGRPAQALDAYDRVIHVEPHFPEAHNNRGNALRALGRLVEAEESYRRALELSPDFVQAQRNLAAIVHDRGRASDAIESLRKAAREQPASAEAQHAVGKALCKAGQLTEGLPYLGAALRIQPGLAFAHHDLGTALKRLGRLVEAEASLAEAVRLNPGSVDSHVNLATLWLLMGDFERGWPEYEWRRRLPGQPLHDVPEPEWDGAPLKGKTILIHAEQGVGDTLHFIRYAPLVEARGGCVVVAAPSRLHKILSTCPGINELVDDRERPSCDVHTPLMSLPRILGTTLESVPADVPYLRPEPARVERWRARLAAIPGRKIGVCWQGNPRHPEDAERSFRLTALAPIARVPDVRLISLQHGNGREQLPHCGFPIETLDDDLDVTGAFTDTAAVVSQLDLVITADTALVHLAGALGAPTWIALARIPDWRWMLDRSDSPWYPSVRLFRKSTAAWDRVFGLMARSLIRSTEK
jgi:tetratricopeptide (TPR) repeat protein